MTQSKKTIYIILVLVLAVGLVGCKESPATIAYNTLATTQGVYQATWGAFKDLHDQGLIDEDKFQEGRKYAIDFYNAWMLASESAMAYQSYVDKGEAVPDSTKRMLEVAMSNFKPVADALFKFMRPIIERSAK